MQWQGLPSAFLPTGDNRTFEDGSRVAAGVELNPIEQRAAYWPYQRHPRDVMGIGDLQQTRVPADEFHHLHVPSETGATRPEVPLAAGVLRSLRNAEFEDANAVLQRNATCLGIMFEEDLPEGEDMPSEEDKRQFIESIMMSPGMIGRAPTGMKARMLNPPANPNFSPTIRINMLYICAGLGTPVHEVTGDYETITERAMAFAGISPRRKADIEHARIEHRLLNPMRRAFVDGCVAMGLWTPPPGRPLWEVYLCDWQWPAMQISRMANELNGLIGAIKAEVIDPDTVTTMMFGMRPEVRARRAAKAAARNQALGFKTGTPLWGPEAEAAARILVEAQGEEARERDIVEASSREDSILDEDLD
jgi:capsid protein